eukprot:Rmarinus@m.2292
MANNDHFELLGSSPPVSPPRNPFRVAEEALSYDPDLEECVKKIELRRRNRFRVKRRAVQHGSVRWINSKKRPPVPGFMATPMSNFHYPLPKFNPSREALMVTREQLAIDRRERALKALQAIEYRVTCAIDKYEGHHSSSDEDMEDELEGGVSMYERMRRDSSDSDVGLHDDAWEARVQTSKFLRQWNQDVGPLHKEALDWEVPAGCDVPSMPFRPHSSTPPLDDHINPYDMGWVRKHWQLMDQVRGKIRKLVAAQNEKIAKNAEEIRDRNIVIEELEKEIASASKEVGLAKRHSSRSETVDEDPHARDRRSEAHTIRLQQELKLLQLEVCCLKSSNPDERARLEREFEEFKKGISRAEKKELQRNQQAVKIARDRMKQAVKEKEEAFAAEFEGEMKLLQQRCNARLDEQSAEFDMKLGRLVDRYPNEDLRSLQELKESCYARLSEFATQILELHKRCVKESARSQALQETLYEERDKLRDLEIEKDSFARRAERSQLDAVRQAEMTLRLQLETKHGEIRTQLETKLVSLEEKLAEFKEGLLAIARLVQTRGGAVPQVVRSVQAKIDELGRKATDALKDAEAHKALLEQHKQEIEESKDRLSKLQEERDSAIAQSLKLSKDAESLTQQLGLEGGSGGSTSQETENRLQNSIKELSSQRKQYSTALTNLKGAVGEFVGDIGTLLPEEFVPSLQSSTVPFQISAESNALSSFSKKLEKFLKSQGSFKVSSSADEPDPTKSSQRKSSTRPQRTPDATKSPKSSGRSMRRKHRRPPKNDTGATGENTLEGDAGVAAEVGKSARQDATGSGSESSVGSTQSQGEADSTSAHRARRKKKRSSISVSAKATRRLRKRSSPRGGVHDSHSEEGNKEPRGSTERDSAGRDETDSSEVGPERDRGGLSDGGSDDLSNVTDVTDAKIESSAMTKENETLKKKNVKLRDQVQKLTKQMKAMETQIQKLLKSLPSHVRLAAVRTLSTGSDIDAPPLVPPDELSSKPKKDRPKLFESTMTAPESHRPLTWEEKRLRIKERQRKMMEEAQKKRTEMFLQNKGKVATSDSEEQPQSYGGFRRKPQPGIVPAGVKLDDGYGSPPPPTPQQPQQPQQPPTSGVRASKGGFPPPPSAPFHQPLPPYGSTLGQPTGFSSGMLPQSGLVGGGPGVSQTSPYQYQQQQQHARYPSTSNPLQKSGRMYHVPHSPSASVSGREMERTPPSTAPTLPSQKPSSPPYTVSPPTRPRQDPSGHRPTGVGGSLSAAHSPMSTYDRNSPNIIPRQMMGRQTGDMGRWASEALPDAWTGESHTSPPPHRRKASERLTTPSASSTRFPSTHKTFRMRKQSPMTARQPPPEPRMNRYRPPHTAR